MKKFISIMLVLILAMSLLAGCGGDAGGVKNNGIKSNDLKDSSETQQRWLRLPDSSANTCRLVVNPDEYSGGASGNFDRLPLNLGLLNDEATVTKTLNDLIFIVESTSANGVGGTDIFVPVYDQEDSENVNTRYTVKKMTCEVEGTKVTAVIGEGDETTAQNITMRSKLEVDFSVDIVAVIDVISSSGVKWKVTGASQKPTYNILAQNDTDATGHFAFNITEILAQQVKPEDDISAMTFNLILSVVGANAPLVFQDYKIVTVERGFQYADTNAATTWYPYGIVSTLTYPNGTAAEVMDYFADYSTVARQIKFTADGSFYLAGKVYGTLTYDEKQNLMIVEGDGFNYVVSPKRKQYVTFYNSEADMLKRVNGTEEPTADTQYWTVGCGRIEVGTDLYVSVALDANKSIEELCEEAKAAVGAGNTAKRIETNIEYWDKYLAAITIPSDLILASAPAAE